ncbi:TetR/AcrR family transcriptional regulator [Rhodococcus fascians]|uniref:TetR/AcrR family transcriptional regulator n=1 Tax=Rhodococcoides fascians TaxID=1828 RepID=UPI00196024A1|nr:TetR/AcrR family transcriptional regulator [Rhodococcus fascians]MBM7244203.1 TetR family transcriptional regulator [Rhodococcus fascians]MBY3810441.1 TetR/AcrR family transcriptional regulator [Rhodococcus fascians]MBY3841936.1 TetR/AcrR family transcriptional regulator [Rhodococcus fascians]MBY3844387.1 TetR/AcrR family transcriptional regulator [Rhodococcus fascians]MBY3850333.1 TetR/AcrR family transcriptional regulator [Rhodococcus fascians]
MTREDAPRGTKQNPRRELVEKQILDQATRLFAEKGFASTTLQDVADATGLTRPALYHYVANKDELLSKLFSETTETPAAVLHEINNRTDLGPTEKLRKMAASIALNQAQNSDRFKLIIRSETDLPDDLLRTHQQSRRHVLKEFVVVIESGIRAGEMRPVDPRTAALGIIGMLNWVAWWQPTGDSDSDRAVAVQLADMAVRAVASAESPAPAQEGPERAISMLRENLDYLERALAEDRTW